MAVQRPVLDQVDIIVRDMDAAVAFYRRLGIEVEDTLPMWASQHRETVTAGDIVLHLDNVEHTRTWNRGWPDSGGSGACVVGFKFVSREEVDRVYADLIGAGYRGQQEPYDAFWGARYAVIEDPDGNAIGMMSPTDPARRTNPDPPA
jgi:uncharacterized glyoxalase superfamily protein PhnB